MEIWSAARMMATLMGLTEGNTSEHAWIVGEVSRETAGSTAIDSHLADKTQTVTAISARQGRYAAILLVRPQ